VPGFGSGPFGSGPFGEVNWPSIVLQQFLPEQLRLKDEEAGGLYLTLAEAMLPLFDFMRHKSKDQFSMRDPREVRTRYNDQLEITVISGAGNGDGTCTVEITGEMEDPDFRFGIGFGWILEVGNKRFEVIRADKNTNLSPGEWDGELLLYGETPPDPGDYIIRQQSLIKFLSRDYGLETDQFEDESFQRFEVENVVQWLNTKGAELGYLIRGLVAGFDITVSGLYAIDPSWASTLPADNVFIIDGNYYTDLAPERPLFDEIRADVELSPGVPFPPYPPDGGGLLDDICFEVPDGVLKNVTGFYGFPPGPLTPFLITLVTNPATEEYHVTFNGVPDAMGEYPQNWTFTDGAANTFWLEEKLATNVFRVAGNIAPQSGGGVQFDYDCTNQAGCGWCRTSKIRVVM
jgi:hypothetical protein